MSKIGNSKSLKATGAAASAVLATVAAEPAQAQAAPAVPVFVAAPGVDVFTSADTPIPIPDQGTITSTIDVGAGGSIADLDVEINLEHSWFGDVDVMLESPDGTVVELFTGVYGTQDPDGSYTFDDEAAEAFGSHATLPAAGGTFTPEDDQLSDFDEKDSAGTWTLTVNDRVSGDDGTLRYWRLLMTLKKNAEEELKDLKATAGTLSRMLTGAGTGNVRASAGNSFVARGQQGSIALSQGNGAGNPTISTKNGKLTGNTYTWLSVLGTGAKQGNDQEYSGGGIQIGVDTALSPNVVLGMALGYNDMFGDTPTAKTRGYLTYAQPYLAYNRGPWSGALSFTYGKANYTQSSAAGIGKADSEIWTVGLSVDRDIPLNNQSALTAMASFHYGEERVKGKSGTLAGSGTNILDFSELSTGVRWSKATANGSYYIGLHADYQKSAAARAITGRLDTDGLSGRLDFGGEIPISDRGSIAAGFDYGGLGTKFSEKNGHLSFVVKF